MNRFVRHLFFLVMLLSAQASFAGVTERTLLDSLDLSEFNTEQKTMIRQELQAYTATLDELAKTNMDEWKKKVNEMLWKLRDGFRIYKLARSPKIDERIKEFESDSDVKVYILSYVDESFLNNIFYRLAEAFYEASRPNSFVIFKFRFGKPANYDPAQPSFYLKKGYH